MPDRTILNARLFTVLDTSNNMGFIEALWLQGAAMDLNDGSDILQRYFS